jgi:hypothetical protein
VGTSPATSGVSSQTPLLGNSDFFQRSSTLSIKNWFITSAAFMGVVVGPFAPVMDPGRDGRAGGAVFPERLVCKVPQNLRIVAGLLERQEVAILLVPPDEPLDLVPEVAVPLAGGRVALPHRLQCLPREVEVWIFLHSYNSQERLCHGRDYPARDVVEDVVHVLNGVHLSPVGAGKSPLKLPQLIALKFRLLRETSFVP